MSMFRLLACFFCQKRFFVTFYVAAAGSVLPVPPPCPQGRLAVNCGWRPFFVEGAGLVMSPQVVCACVPNILS